MSGTSVCDECIRHGCMWRSETNSPTPNITGCLMLKHKVKMTNADRIRAMSDEELAAYLSNLGDMCVTYCPFDHLCGTGEFLAGRTCEEAALMWLKQESKE